MWKKIKWLIFIVIFAIIVTTGIIISNIMFKGFTLSSYTTDNKLEVSLQKVLKDKKSMGSQEKVKELGFTEYKGEYIGFFEVSGENSLGEVFIVSYSKVGKVASNILLSTNKITKGDNKLLTVRRDNSYLILMGVDKSQYVGINILDNNTEKILKEIDFEKDTEESYVLEELDEGYKLIEYNVENEEEIKLELVKRSGE